MRKSGLQLLLSSMGIDINTEEIMKKYQEAKDIMPKLADFVSKLDARLARIEERLGIENANGVGNPSGGCTELTNSPAGHFTDRNGN